MRRGLPLSSILTWARFRENEILSKTILTCLSGAQMASIHEIKKCQKSRDTAQGPLPPSTNGSKISFNSAGIYWQVLCVMVLRSKMHF